MKKENAVKIITECAKDYHTYLENHNLAFLFGSPQKAEFFEAVFLPRHFLHLTGVDLTGKKGSGSSDFYEMALKGQLSPSMFSFAANGTTEMKLLILPKLMKIYHSAKMVGDYNYTKSVLYTEKIAGNVSACLGFVREDKYYIPNTALKDDIRDITCRPQQRVLAIFKKPTDQYFYSEVSYIAKGIRLQSIILPAELASRISVADDKVI